MKFQLTVEKFKLEKEKILRVTCTYALPSVKRKCLFRVTIA